MLNRKIIRRQPTLENTTLGDWPVKIQQIYAARNIKNAAELDYQLKGLLPPAGLKSIDIAVDYLYQAIEKNQSILIVGDFDADGATSSALMIKSLKMLGAKKVNFLVPDRFNFGYGLSVKLVEHAASYNPELIVTVDNGIANIDGVSKANQLGIPVIITDHHLAAEQLPDAVAIVNPNQPGCEFASKNLAGVGVAFYLMLALRAKMRTTGWFSKQGIEEPNLAELLDIVALGTVADVVILDKNNRILVEQGLKRIRSGLACPGIMAILQVANRDYRRCQANDLGFAVGPRLNAAGRLEDMSIGINCLLAENRPQAEQIAQQLDQLNRSRRTIEQEMLTQANLDVGDFLKQNISDKNEQRPMALCLYDPAWHQGVIGILASRVKDKINRPVIVFASDGEHGIKGSARSVKGVHIRDVLALVDVRHPELIEKFGGHAMAAGLSLNKENFQVFADAFHDAVVTVLNGETIKDEIVTDAGLGKEELTLEFAKILRVAGPWGQGFPEPLFDDEFKVINSRVVGEDHLKLVVEKEGIMLDGIFFRCPEEQRAQSGDGVRLVYKLDINEFRGKQTAQLMIEQLEILGQ